MTGEQLRTNEAPSGKVEASTGGVQLYRAADLSALAFATTDDLAPLTGLVGQDRALDAIRFAAGVKKAGFNLFAVGRMEAGIRQAAAAILAQQAPARPAPSDWAYVNNFADERRPIAIALDAGRARAFERAMRELIEDLKAALPAVFAGEDYQTRHGGIDATFHKQQIESFGAVEQKAGAKGVALLRTPLGFTLAAVQNGEVVPPEQVAAWPEEKHKRLQADLEALERDLEHVLRQVPQREKARRESVRELNRKTAQDAVGHLIDERKALFADNAAIVAHLDRVRADLVDNVAMFMAAPGEDADARVPLRDGPFERYQVNVLVTHAPDAGAPIVEELHPTVGALIGSIKHLSVQGALVTNFRLIKARALHHANGGFLLLNARDLLVEPFSWTALKRSLRRRDIVIEDVSRLIGLTSTVSLEPDPIPLDVKVVLFGDRLLYFLLAALDSELAEHFKVLADFDDEIDRTPESEALLARLTAALVREAELSPVDRGGVALIIEHAARLADDSGKLSALVEQVRDVLVEADYWAKDGGRPMIIEADVARAIDERIRRAARLRDGMQEAIVERAILVDTTGEKIGQVNGLSVIELGGFSFGKPTRITCQVRPGTGRLVDIEREVELGGPIHSKGVLILSGFLAGRFALDTPMSLHASLVFEQSYSPVEGDSASAAELCALVSALAGAPLRQDLAIIGSVKQHGDIQAVGGVNEKIEGFFDLCAARGLTGFQGVIIPRANATRLMLRKDVREAYAAGRFSVHAITTIDEGLTLLTDLPAGERGAEGLFPPASIVAWRTGCTRSPRSASISRVRATAPRQPA